MSDTQTNTIPKTPHAGLTMLRMLWRDKFAFFAAIFLLIVVAAAIFAPMALDEVATKPNLRGRNAPPFDFSKPWYFWLGGDALGRPLLARIFVAAQNTMMVASGAVLASLTIGTTLGLIAGYTSKMTSQVIMRLADVIMSFPSLLLAVIVLYMLPPSVLNLVIVLAITRIPVYLRTARAEVLEIRERMFVQAAQVMGASARRIIFRHILPVILPTLVTIATLDFALVVLVESSLSFLGIGIQPPEITWGLDGVAGPRLSDHRLVAVVLARTGDHPHHAQPEPLSNWMRTALDPVQRWRLEIARKKNG